MKCFVPDIWATHIDVMYRLSSNVSKEGGGYEVLAYVLTQVSRHSEKKPRREKGKRFARSHRKLPQISLYKRTGAQNFQNSSNHLKILGDRKVT